MRRFVAGITIVSRVLTGIAGLALLIMMLATGWDVVARALFNRPLHGVVEIVEIMVLMVAFLGLPEAFLRDENVKVDLVDMLLAERLFRVVRVLALVLTVAFLALLAWNLLSPMSDAYLFGDIKPDLRIPLYPLYGAVFVSIAASIVTTLTVIFRELGGRVTP